MQLNYKKAIQHLNSGYVLLVSRSAFSSEEEIRQSYPPTGDEHLWEERAKPWYENRRHLYIICIDPSNPSQYYTSSAEPDKSSNPWKLKFCSDHEAITLLDIDAVLRHVNWNKYKISIISLSKKDYPREKIISIIKKCRLNLQQLPYSIESNGYDCQTATRDVLQMSNQIIDANELRLPLFTDVLAYKSTKKIIYESYLQSQHCGKSSVGCIFTISEKNNSHSFEKEFNENIRFANEL